MINNEIRKKIMKELMRVDNSRNIVFVDYNTLYISYGTADAKKYSIEEIKTSDDIDILSGDNYLLCSLMEKYLQSGTYKMYECLTENGDLGDIRELIGGMIYCEVFERCAKPEYQNENILLRIKNEMTKEKLSTIHNSEDYLETVIVHDDIAYCLLEL